VKYLYGTKALSSYMVAAAKQYSSFFGAQHMSALVRVVGGANMPLIMYQLMKVHKDLSSDLLK